MKAFILSVLSLCIFAVTPGEAVLPPSLAALTCRVLMHGSGATRPRAKHWVARLPARPLNLLTESLIHELQSVTRDTPSKHTRLFVEMLPRLLVHVPADERGCHLIAMGVTQLSRLSQRRINSSANGGFSSLSPLDVEDPARLEALKGLVHLLSDRSFFIKMLHADGRRSSRDEFVRSPTPVSLLHELLWVAKTAFDYALTSGEPRELPLIQNVALSGLMFYRLPLIQIIDRWHELEIGTSDQTSLYESAKESLLKALNTTAVTEGIRNDIRSALLLFKNRIDLKPFDSTESLRALIEKEKL